MIKTGDSWKRHADEVTNEQFDTIVIGSGIGGLTAAVMLATYAEQRVLVLERHYVAGGFTHSFARSGYDYHAGLTDWRDQMVAYFPGEVSAIDAYIREVKDAVKHSQFFFAEKALPDLAARVAGRPLRSRFLSHANRTTREVLESLTDNQRLIAVLTGQFGDYGLPPARSSFAMHAIVTNHYFRGGAYPIGGASVIPAGAAQVIERAGGRVMVGAEVDEVIVREGRALGVRMADGRELLADNVVSNAGVHVTYGDLLPDEVAQDLGVGELLDKVERSVGHLSLYLGLDASTEELGLQKPNLWLFPNEDHDANFDAFEADPDAPLPMVYVSFPSAKDPDFERRHPGHSTIDVITMARHDWFSAWDGTRWRGRGAEYEARKADFTGRMLDMVFQQVPQARDHIDVAELSTPLTTQHFMNYGTGELYGLDHTSQRFDQKWLRPRNPVKGLFLTGQDVFTCGVGAAMFGGALTASSMIGKDLLSHALLSKVGLS